MKELQKTVESYITNRHKQKKYLAVLTALSIMISFVVPFTLIEPAISTTGDGINPMAANAAVDMLQNYSGTNGNIVDDVTYSPKEMSVKDLLIGYTSNDETHSWANGCTTAAEIIESAKRQYFLGIAYDFCVFLENNFEPTGADAEGRVAVGGNVIATVSKGNYQIGAGDFGTNTALKDTDNYQGITDFAHLITNGYISKVDPYGTKNGGAKAADYNGDFFKRMVIGNYEESKHRHNDNNSSVSYDDTHKDNHYLLGTGNNDWIAQHPATQINEKSQLYEQPTVGIIDFTETFEWLRNQSEALSAKTSIQGVVDGSTITFTIPKNIKAGDTVYFSLESWPENVKDIYFEFEDKENPPVVRDGLKLVEDNYNEPEGSWCPTCNIVINCGGNSFGTGNSDKLTNTYVNGLPISNRPAGIKDGNYFDNVKATNNRLASEKILYNFYEAGKTDDSVKSTLKGNFNGTIFAPYANVESAEGCDGHLSGALIAKSFHGGMEFGYRPYRGTIDILGSKAGYAVPFDKFIVGTTDPLAGASFVVTDENGKNVLSWTSDESTKYAEIPAEVDFTGETDYSENDALLELFHTYTVMESKAPTGYLKSDKAYKVLVNEIVNKDYLLEMTNDSGVRLHIPQVVDVTITIIPVDENGTEGQPETFDFQIRDAYNASGYLSQRKVVMKDENGEITEVYAINLDENQNITQLGKIDVGFADETESQQPTVPEETQPETVPAEEEITTDNDANVNQGEEITTESEEIQPEAETTDAAAPADNSVDGDEQPTTESIESTTEDLLENNGDSEIIPDDENAAANSYKIINEAELTEIIYDLNDVRLKSSGVIEETNYYYDKNSIMVMPLPQTTPRFENKPGFLFTKVDSSGKALTGATIKLYAGDAEVTDENIWAWDPTDPTVSSYLIDIDKLNTNTIYYFKETEPPYGYEVADSIYLKKGSDGKLYYGSTENNITTEIIKNENGYYSIEMTDIKISGAIIKLQKWKSDMSNRLEGAKFQLLTSGNELIYPMEGSFEIPLNEDFDLFTTLRNADAETYNTDYVQNGYLKPGKYILHETVPPGGGYQAQDFKFKVKAGADGSFEIEPLKSGSSSMADPEDMYLQTASDGNALLVITGTLLQMAKDNPDETFVDNLGTVDQVHVSLDGNDWGGNLSISNKNSYTFNEILNASGKNPDEIKYIRFMRWSDNKRPFNDVTSIYYEGNPASSGGSSSGSDSGDGTGLINGMNGNNGTVTVNGALLEAAKKQPDKPFVRLDKTGGGQIHILTNSITNIDQGQIANNVDKSEYSLNDIFSMAQSAGKASNINDITSVRFMEWTGGSALTGTALLEVSTPEPTTQPSTDPSEEEPESDLLDLVIADDGTIKIPNQKPGTNISIIAEKIWADDTGFESLRPEEISVTLKRKLPGGSGDNSFDEHTATLNAANQWKATWSGLPRLVDENGGDVESNQYKYYVDEINAPTNYRVEYSENNEGLSANGTITITNTLKTKNIQVIKHWLDAEGNAVTPEGTPNVTVKLKWKDKDSSEEFTDVSGKTLVLKSPDYTGTFEKLPENKDYQVVEVNVPQGWKFDKTIGNADDGFTINNKPDMSGLKVKKIWDDNYAESLRPDEIKLKLYRTIIPKEINTPNFDPNIINDLVPDYSEAKYTSQGITQTNDYARLLQYSLYFYDANMCGSQVGETSAYSWRDDCHTYDGEVSGGFHDAGDHVMFGLPQGFSASTLGWSYYEFQDSFDNLGLTDHYQEIMKEFCDFFVKSTKMSNGTVSQLYVQKGDGGTDHSKGWVPPEEQSQNNRGGLVWTSDSGSNVAADYAAALAQYYLNFPNDSNSAQYLEYAKALYAYSTSKNKTYSVNEYSDDNYVDEQAWAAAWLYLATKEDSYKTDCRNKLSSLSVPERGHFWGNPTLGAAVYTTCIDSTDTAIKSKVTDYLNRKCQGNNFVVVDSESGIWGSIRHNALAQTVALIYDKHQDSPSYTEWAKGQMAYILGNNNVASNGKSSTCFVTGFADNSPINLHHRAASNLHDNDNWTQWNSWNGEYSQIEGSHIIVGALVGGNGDNSSYKDNCKDHVGNEVALDYNAGLVAAAAGLYDVYKTGYTYSNVTAQAQNAEPDAQSFDFDENALNGVTLKYNAPAVLGDESYIDLNSNQIDKAINESLDIEQLCSEKTITKIVIEWSNYNGSVVLNGATVFQGVNQFPYCSYENNVISISPMDEEHFHCPWGGSANPKELKTLKFNKWGGDISSVKLYYAGPPGIQITSDKDITITEGDTAIITANQSATWSIEPADNNIQIVGEATGNTCTVKANNYTANEYIVKAAADGKEVTVTVHVSAKDIQILQNNTPVTEPIKIRKNGSAVINVAPTDNIEFNADSGVTVTGSNGQYTITAGETPIEDAAITFTRNGKSAAVHVTVLGNLTINGSDAMNKKDTQQLTAENVVGTLTWEVIEGGDLIEISPEGIVTSKDKDGKAKVKVTDSDGSTAEFEIEVKLTGIIPTIPENEVLDGSFEQIIILNSGNNWQKEVTNLPKADANGNEYHYYIVEVGADNEPINVVHGNNVTYYPTKYEGNGSVITGDNTVLSVTNTLSGDKPVTMPSTGGEGVRKYYAIGLAFLFVPVTGYLIINRRKLKLRKG